MKKRILLYSIIFLILLVLYLYVSSNKQYELQSTKIEELRGKIDTLKTEVTTYKDSVNTLLDVNANLHYFSFENNGEAINYFEGTEVDVQNLPQIITDAIYDQNSASANNPLVPFDGTSGKFMSVDRVKVINHKWVICSFTDGDYWGEMLLRYEINGKTKELTFELISEVLYPKYEG
ncbi:hypothetical protein C8N46_102355 [Kordia periserrulae]|uniref:Hydrolase n=1 Tax=Kordia periserrulae TaxID=701523 RepID=A0A2T6C3S2_9FLAO|nr:hypothetical protein [Kordia periserrulae]PTX62954.1 hypothetical protein C8N46_102355 [Kordia periserrulae]